MEIEMLEDPEILDRAEISGTTVLVKYRKTEAALAELRTKYKGIAFDLTTTKGDKEARAARLELVTLRTGLEKKRKEFKAPALEFGKKIDSEAERITAEIVALETAIDLQIKADEKRRADEKAEKERIEAERVQALRAKVAAIWALVEKCHGISAERIGKGIAMVQAIDTSPVVFFELSGDAEQTRSETVKAMQAMHAAAVEREAEAARIEVQRVENERLAAELKTQADAQAAQQVVIDKAAAELKAAQDAATKEAARLEAERERIRREEVARIEALQAKERREAQASIDEQERTAKAIAEAQAKIDASRIKNNASGQPAREIVQVMGMPVPRDIYEGTQFFKQHVAPKPASSTSPSLKLGVIAERLGFTLTADFLKSLGFEPAATDRASKLYHEHDFSLICSALVKHINGVQVEQAA